MRSRRILLILPFFLSAISLALGAQPSIRIVDAAGRTVRLAKPPERILVIGRGPHIILHLLYMFPEGRERLAGSVKKGKWASNFLPLVDPGFENKKMLGDSPGPEEIAALEPDLVLTRNDVSDGLAAALDKIGIPLVHLGLETPDQFFKDLSNLGILLDNEARAEKIAAFFRARIERIREGLSGLRENDKPRVMLAMGLQRGGKLAVQVPAVSWIQTIQVQTAGGVPVWRDAALESGGWTIVNFEQIARWDPDKIFIVVWHTLDPQKAVDSLKGDRQWRELQAVKAKELYAFPADIFGWDSPDPRWILGMTWLAVKIHPERFKAVDLTEEIYGYFGELYGLTRHDVAAKILPTVHLDVR
ncbi:MAG TPA: ABC transporter substrate-binding protein [Candidatus Desulfaltia sp.]|nr:ABC transporter substrate-binding protein [Candidatus Desulfaltia sp.]